MSPTNTITQLGEALNDYTIHLTGHDATNHQMIEEDTLASNQRNWPTDYHRVPPHRPINRDLDPEERPRGSNTAEFIFISIMFTGVFTSASLAQLWGRTGGPFCPNLFNYAIGGEW